MQIVAVAIFAMNEKEVFGTMDFINSNKNVFSYQKTHTIESEDLQTISVHHGGELKNAEQSHEPVIQECYACRYPDHPFPASYYCRLC
jgi:hypothetical protein